MPRFKLFSIAVMFTFVMPKASCAEEINNPYKIAKEGEWAVYKKMGYFVMGDKKVAVPGEWTVKVSLISITDKVASVKVEESAQVLLEPNKKQIEVNLTKKYNFGASIEDATEAQVIKESDEKITVAGKEYNAHLTKTKLTEKTGFPKWEAVANTWIAKDGPVGGVIKMEIWAKEDGVNSLETYELTGSSNRK